MKDKFFIGILGGTSGAISMSVINFLINLIPGVNMKLIFGVSELFVPQSLFGTFQGALIGFIAHLTCGALLGLVVFGILEIFGYEYLLLKGAILGLAFWFIMCGIVGRILNLGMQDKFMDNILLILIHIPFGVTTAWVIRRLQAKTLV